MIKKITALFMVLVMVLAMTACTTTETPADSPAATDGTAETPAESAGEAPAASGDVPTLVYYAFGNQDVNVRTDVQNAINAYIEPLIGAHVEFQIISSGDWSQKALTALQSGEKVDIFFTADWLSYVRSISQGLFTPLNDDNGANGNLLEQYGQGILESLNPASSPVPSLTA